MTKIKKIFNFNKFNFNNRKIKVMKINYCI